jgi:hypothetical protein
MEERTTPTGPMRRQGAKALGRSPGNAARVVMTLVALAWCGMAHAAEPEPAPSPRGGPTGTLGPTIGTTPTAPPAAADDVHDYKLRELEEKVVTLKEKVFRSKTRLLLLKERLLNDVIAEAKVVIFHENDMGSSFKPVQVLYHLDGEKIYFQDDTTKLLEEQQNIEIFAQNMVPGNHVLSVEMVYRGDSSIFAYLKDYLFKLRASYTFYATKGKITTVRAIGYQKGDITYDLRERPSITFDVKQVSYTSEEPINPGAPATPGATPGAAPTTPPAPEGAPK